MLKESCIHLPDGGFASGAVAFHARVLQRFQKGGAVFAYILPWVERKNARSDARCHVFLVFVCARRKGSEYRDVAIKELVCLNIVESPVFQGIIILLRFGVGGIKVFATFPGVAHFVVWGCVTLL